MAERKRANIGTQRSAKSAAGKAPKRFTDEERAAMKERASARSSGRRLQLMRS